MNEYKVIPTRRISLCIASLGTWNISVFILLCGGENLPVKRRSPLRRDLADAFEVAVAVGTRERRKMDFFRFGLRAQPEQMAHPSQRFVSGGAEETVMAHAHEAFGQNMNQPATDKLDRLERHGPPLAGVAVFAAQADASCVVVASEALLAEGGFGNVGGGVAQGRFPFSDVSAVDTPLGFPDGGIDLAMQVGMAFGECLVEAVADSFDQGLPGDEEAFGWRVGQPATAGGDSDGGHDQVNVRVMEHLAGPCVQDGQGGGVASESAGVLAKLAQGAPGRLEEQPVGLPRSVKEDPAQFVGDGGGDHVVGHRQQSGLLVARPLTLVVSAACRAGAVIATVIGEVAFAALGAAVRVAALARSTAGEHRLDCAAVLDGNAVKAAHAFDVGGPVRFEDLGECHFLPTMRSKRACWTWRPLLSLISVTCK